MRVANTVDLKNKTNELLRHAIAGDPVIITLRGKPAASLTRLTEAELESFVLRHAGIRRPETRPQLPWRYTSLRTPLGTAYVAYSEQGVGHLDLADSEASFERTFRRRFSKPVHRDVRPPGNLRRALIGFFTQQEPFRGDVDLTLVGPFERSVLEQLRRIPRGQVRTYREVATALGHPSASRAVGNACAKNPVPLIIPCHRVIRSDGGLGGYSLRGGPGLKRQLLNEEGANLEKRK
ncbi:MAG TPA: type II toxin-antitoxin system prevent-host-death family antitoxin [bacterium]|nr:type II toxin-antitoxin system prevent-host-death family antitoxin [bacterium]